MATRPIKGITVDEIVDIMQGVSSTKVALYINNAAEYLWLLSELVMYPWRITEPHEYPAFLIVPALYSDRSIGYAALGSKAITLMCSNHSYRYLKMGSRMERKIQTGMGNCPLCGSTGVDIAFAFRCDNRSCKNHCS